MNNIMDGKALSLKIKEELRNEIEENNLSPNLTVIQIGDNKASEVVIDEGVRIIDVDAFREFSSLKRVSIADTVTQISKSAFCECKL